VTGERWGGRFYRAFRIALGVWTFVVIAADLAAFFALPPGDYGGVGMSATDVIIFFQFFLLIVWFLGFGLITLVFAFLD
jgi:hypothetical protein